MRNERNEYWRAKRKSRATGGGGSVVPLRFSPPTDWLLLPFALVPTLPFPGSVRAIVELLESPLPVVLLFRNGSRRILGSCCVHVSPCFPAGRTEGRTRCFGMCMIIAIQH